MMFGKSTLAVLVLVSSCNLIFSQEIKTVLKAPDSWRTEIIAFPLSFAPEVDFVGIEDIRFAPGWSNPKSEDFWTYHFVWYVDKEQRMTKENLTVLLQYYYDGLMATIIKNQDNESVLAGANKTRCQLNKNKEGFEGKISIYDAFFTKERITLNVKVEETLCWESNKQLIAFDLSPKSFDDVIWDRFDQIEFIGECHK